MLQRRVPGAVVAGGAVSRSDAFVGVSDHGGWAVLVTVAGDGRLLDRRRVDLVDEQLPKIPYHHEAQRLPLEEALDLVERVRVSAERHATLALAAVADAVSSPIAGIAIRTCPPLPATVAERLGDYRARNVADWVMYRKALAGAAEGRGWPITGTTGRRCSPPRSRRCRSRTSTPTSAR